ncbi:hypothetical protein EJB05_02594, partial [Eragrostis curvula]
MTSLCSLTDDLLAEIFLHLPTLADVGRTATACAAFRRVIADHAFRRRLRSIHPAPLLLGFLSGATRFHPAEPPHSSAPAAQSLKSAADFSFSFVVPSAAGRRFPIDARDGRVLLNNHGQDYNELVVCDPLHRQYLMLPEIPQGDSSSSAGASPDRPQWKKQYRRACLVPAGADEDVETSSFKVLYMEEWSPEPPSAFVFSSATGQWSRLAMDGILAGTIPPLYTMHRRTPCYANGCFYWIFTTSDVSFSFLFHDDDDDEKSDVDRLLVLDTRSMEFSTIDLPPPGPGYAFCDHVIVEADEGGIGMFTLHKGIFDSLDSYLEYTTRGVVDGEWQPRRIVLTLPPRHTYKLVGATDRCLLLHGAPSVDLMQSPSWDKSNMWGTSDVDFSFFSVEFGSMQIKRVCRSLQGEGVPYTGFPPSLSLPKLQLVVVCESPEARRGLVSSAATVCVDQSWPEDTIKDETCWSDKELCKQLGHWYSVAKIQAEEMALEYGEQNGLHVVTILPGMVVGPLLQTVALNTTMKVLRYLALHRELIALPVHNLNSEAKFLSLLLFPSLYSPEVPMFNKRNAFPIFNS